MPLNPATLIIGKVIALFIVGLVQILVVLSPIAVGYLYFPGPARHARPDLSTLSFESEP